MKPPSRIRNPTTLALLGKQLRRAREAAGLSQGNVKRMRQGTVSKIENGREVTLDTFIAYATSLGLEVALVPIGRAKVIQDEIASQARASTAAEPKSVPDLLTQFDYVRDPE